MASQAIQTAGYQPIPYATSVTPKAPSTTAPGSTTPPKPPSAPGFDVTTDPGYQAALAAQNKGNADVDALLGKGLSSLFINYGSPALASQLSQYGYSLNPNDASAAQANYKAGNAILARLDQQHALNRQGVINSLAAHGLINSGDTGYRLGQEDQAYGQGIYDQTQNVLNQAFNLQQNALQQKSQLQQGIVSALQSAWQNFINNPQQYAQPPAAPSDNYTPPSPPDLSGLETPAQLQSAVSTPNAQAIYPASNSTPTAVRISANRTGGSANRTQGVFSIH